MAYGEKQGTIGQWSIEKLQFIEDYLPHYLRATKSALHKYYIDCFAGKGTWKHRKTGEIIDGSSAISMKYSDKFTKLFYIEYEEDRCKELEKLANIKGCTNYEIVQGNCNIEIDKILNKIHKRAPIFVFVDPSSDQVHFSMLKKLAEWKTELFILFPFHMTISRYLPVDKSKLEQSKIERLNDFFGSEEWLQIYKNNKNRIYLYKELIDHYIENLKSVGYKYVMETDLFKVPAGPKLYTMIWVGKHPVGDKIMESVFKNQQKQLSLF